MKKKYILLFVAVIIVVSGFSFIVIKKYADNLTEKYINTKYGYSFNYPEGYKVETYTTSDAGYDSPNTPADSSSNPIIVGIKGKSSWFLITTGFGGLPFTDENIKKGYAIEPSVIKTQIDGLQAYKLTFPTDKSINYEIYHLRKPDGFQFEFQIPTNDTLSSQILKSFKFIQ